MSPCRFDTVRRYEHVRVLFNCDPDSSHAAGWFGHVSEFLRGVGHDPLIMVGVRLLTPPLREIYAVLMQAGIMVVDD